MQRFLLAFHFVRVSVVCNGQLPLFFDLMDVPMEAVSKMKLALSRFLWGFYFPTDPYTENDRRNAIMQVFEVIFLDQHHPLTQKVRAELEMSHSNSQIRYVSLCGKELSAALPFTDFLETLQVSPKDVLGCLGIVLTAVFIYADCHTSEFLPSDQHAATILRPRIENFTVESTFGDVKATTVNQLVSVKGRVVRVDRSRCVITGANFICSKCRQETFAVFEDGVYQPPECSGKRCANFRVIDTIRIQ